MVRDYFVMQGARTSHDNFERRKLSAVYEMFSIAFG